MFKNRFAEIPLWFLFSILFLIFAFILFLVIYWFFILTNTHPIFINKSQMKSGVSSDLEVNRSVNFLLNNENHSLTISSIKYNIVHIIIESKKIELDLKIGEEKKFDLNDDGFYDLLIKIVLVNNDVANVEIKEIHESISMKSVVQTNNEVPPNNNFTANQICGESWNCDSWSYCVNGAQTRNCWDEKNCNTILMKPINNRTCFLPNNNSPIINPNLSQSITIGSINNTQNSKPYPGLNSYCFSLYDNFNDASDNKRFNLVFIGVGFNNIDDLKKASKRVIDLDGTSNQFTLSDGLMQIPVFKNNVNRFNFWYVSRLKTFSSLDSSSIKNDLYQFDWINDCQKNLSNRVIPIFIYPGQGVTNYPYASMGRYDITLYDCIDTNSNCNGYSTTYLQNSNVHEMLHTIACLGDEYGNSGNSNGQAVTFSGQLNANLASEFYIGNSYNDCIQNSPWAKSGYIGKGCGLDGQIDCFSSSCTLPLNFSNGIDNANSCCIGGKDCSVEVGCFEGGSYADKGIWRSSAGDVMRNPYSGTLKGPQFINLWDQNIVSQVFNKGPAVGKIWNQNGNYQLDCDITNSQFAS